MGKRSLFRLLLTSAVPMVVFGLSVQLGIEPGALSWALSALSIVPAGWLFLVQPAARHIEQLERRGQALSESHSGMVADLRRERDLLESILDAMNEGLLLLDEGDRIVLVNPSLRQALLLPAEVVGKPLVEALSRSELHELVQQARDAAGPTAGEIGVGELKPRRFAVRANRMRQPAGALLLVFFDVTEIRRLESLRRDFVANVSHELRTPVAAICSAAETLLGGALRDPNAASMFAEIIERNSERMRRLVEDLLDLSRIESKDYKLEREPLDVRPIVERSLGLLAPKAKEGRIRTDVEIWSGLSEVYADRRALEQVLVNLVENSIKYCPPGSRVVVRAGPIGEKMVRVAIEDTGPGIAAADLPRLFERFYRVDAGRSRDMGGTGLGLSIVKHLVEAMGGSVGVESRVGFGSNFWFTLPVAPPASANARANTSVTA